MSLDEDGLIEALEGRDPPWTQQAVTDIAAEPERVKRTAQVCADCERPCYAEEVCATAVVDELNLLDEVGREQAFHSVESGMSRLELRDRGTVREEGDHRPNTFFELE